METFDTLGELLMKRYEAEYDNMRKSLPSLFNRLYNKNNILFDNVHWNRPLTISKYLHATNDGPCIYTHSCGPQGGRYRISKKGTCYKCKKMIGSYKKLDTMRGLKALTSNEEEEGFKTFWNGRALKVSPNDPLPFP